MAISFDSATLAARFRSALEEARARAAAEPAEPAEPEPSPWYQRGRDIAHLRYVGRAYLIVTALLARSLNATVDPLELRTDDALPRTYSARTVAHETVLPIAREEGLNLFPCKKEPLNGQPFFRYDRVDDMKRVKYPADIGKYVEWLKEIDTMECDAAFEALVEFLRARVDDPLPETRDPIPATDLIALADIATVAAQFVSSASSGGKRAQAVATGALSLIFPSIQTHQVNSGRGKPGDLYAFSAGRCVLAGEVKDKPVTYAEIETFVESVSSTASRVIYIAVARDQPPVDVAALISRAATYGVELRIYTSMHDLVDFCVSACPQSAERRRVLFASNCEQFLLEVGAEPAIVEDWREAMTRPEARE